MGQTLEDKLDIIIVTYNREIYLKKTLEYLLYSSFNKCRITVLNNSSSDKTLEICNKYKDQFIDFFIVTNSINIGGDANILRAFEYGDKDYIWVLADDDEYDFSSCEDIINTINEGEVELIHVGAHPDTEWNWGCTSSPKELVKMGYPYFRNSSFLPCNIFKRSAFIPYIQAGYRNIPNMYPHMPYLLSIYSENKPVYISSRRIVKAVIGNQDYSYKNFVHGWVNTSYLLKSQKDISLCLFQQFKGPELKIGLSFMHKSIYNEINPFIALKVFWALRPLNKIIGLIVLIPYMAIKSSSRLIKLVKRKFFRNKRDWANN